MGVLRLDGCFGRCVLCIGRYLWMGVLLRDGLGVELKGLGIHIYMAYIQSHMYDIHRVTYMYDIHRVKYM